MLKRIYVDNYKSLVNFDLSVDSIGLFLGPNGTGKSSVFEVLRKIQAFVTRDEKTDVLFKPAEKTRWQTSSIQTFELEIKKGKEGTYKYELAIEHDKEKPRARVKHERLSFNDKPLLKFESGDVQLYRDDHSLGPKYPFNWSQSAIASILPRKDNTRLTWFKQRVERFIVVQINPMMMSEDSSQEETRLSPRMDNFVSWYRYISQDQGKTIKLTKSLEEVLDGFNYFRFVEAGEQNRVLRVYFSEENSSQPTGYRFSELSDGQRLLIALYTLIYCTRDEDYTLCIDEPENFLALREIQPWLVTLYDFCNSGAIQALLISHHPEIINYLLTSPVGYWFDRQNNGPVRIEKIVEDNDSGLPVSELIARGWLHG